MSETGSIEQNSQKNLLPMCIYKIEKKFGFTGKGVLSGLKFKNQNVANSKEEVVKNVLESFEVKYNCDNVEKDSKSANLSIESKNVSVSDKEKSEQENLNLINKAHATGGIRTWEWRKIWWKQCVFFYVKSSDLFLKTYFCKRNVDLWTRIKIFFLNKTIENNIHFNFDLDFLILTLKYLKIESAVLLYVKLKFLKTYLLYFWTKMDDDIQKIVFKIKALVYNVYNA